MDSGSLGSSRETRSAFSPGTVVSGRYEILDTVGTGGMGAVLRVVDRALENDIIAMKLLYPHMAGDRTALARFRNEVLLSRRLSHPNIVRLYDFGSAGQGYYYFTMEYIRGNSLGQRIANRPLPFAQALQFLFEICQAIQYAHQKGVVHRDLKPDNILVDEDGTLKLTDFGLAKSLIMDKGLTATGETVGTPFYMAPEQLRGDRTDPRVDIYSLGILAFEMVTGDKPFKGDTYMRLAAQHLNNPLPRIKRKELGIPAWFQEFVDDCAAKKANERYASIDEVAEVLFEEMHDLGIPIGGLCGRFCPHMASRQAKTGGFALWPFGRGKRDPVQ